MKKLMLCTLSLSLFCCGLYAAAQAAPAKKAAGTKKPAAAKPAPKPAQDLTPVQQLQVYVDGFHNYWKQVDLPADQQHQMRVTHYCQPVSDDFIQCVVFDGNTRNAHLIGLEHIISHQQYLALPEKEKAYWHPHDGEVDSGMLAAPGFPDEKGLLANLRSTHGKTWHVWDAHKDKLPMGEPSLMWAVDPNKMSPATKQGMAARKKNVTF